MFVACRSGLSLTANSTLQRYVTCLLIFVKKVYAGKLFTMFAIISVIETDNIYVD